MTAPSVLPNPEVPSAEAPVLRAGPPEPFWKRARRTIGGVCRTARGLFPLTAAGFLVLVLAGLSLYFLGLKRSDLVVLAAASLAALLALLAALGTLGASLLFRWALGHPSGATGLLLECGSPSATGFVPPWPTLLPLLEMEWRWEEPGGAEVLPEPRRGSWLETVVMTRRGDRADIVRRYEIRDVLGLSSVAWRVREERAVRALPHRGKLDTLALLDGLAGGDDFSDPRGEAVGDRVDMRQYSQGDSPRMILWKVYARTRKLLVRVPERAVAARPRSCGYLVAGAGDEASAGLLRVVLERGFLGEGWRFGADGCAGYASSLDEALDFLVRSGDAPPEGPTGLREFLSRAEADGYSACFLAVPPGDGPWVEPALEAAAGTRLRVHLTTAVDGGTDGEPREPRWRRLVFRTSGEERGAEALRTLARRLEPAPFPCLLVSRTQGRVLGDLRRLTGRKGGRR